MSDTAFHRRQAEMLPSRPAPAGQTGAVGWMRANLFSSPFNILLTLISLFLLWSIIPPAFDWAFFDAEFVGTSRDDCVGGAGACWAWIDQRIDQFVYGFYPAESRWRVNLAVLLLIPALAWVLIEKAPGARYGRWFALFYPVIATLLLVGGLGLEEVTTDKFGGFMLNLVAGLAGIVLSLPIGILLALGRRSKLPVVRVVSVTFIEVIRGVPLITLLFVAIVILNLFLPQNVSLDQLARVMIMVTLFASAYIAEVIRGGLQAIPAGQYEAAQAMGLGYWKMMRLIILPQALKISIPGIVNTFIGLFKDTTLVIIIGLFDILGQARLLQTNPEWIGEVDHETYVLASVFFFVICFSMSRYSIGLEKRLDTSGR
ncbi:amino acid ABC transporter permease [Thioalkalivibrio sp. HK1]|uniref:amino acid ABC transporter permease n=1 Tax=Thioalkalivibrio sp. HK1 TaxID=1469245 RepID=UPI00046EA325|nr:amino acid ABC transporter permease [Thioalkalivibrio sp. HK1]